MTETTTKTTSVEDFTNYIQYVENKLVFRNLTLSQWYDKIIFPNLSDYLDKEEIAKLNAVAVNYSEIIYSNIAIAKNTLTVSKAKHTAAIQKFKVDYIDDFENTPSSTGFKKKAPTADLLEARAAVACHSHFQALTLAELVYDFWKFQVDKLQVFNSRLTSLNISLHNDEKYSNLSTG